MGFLGQSSPPRLRNVRIRLNGQWRQQARGLTVAALLAELSLEPRRVAVELNRNLLPRARYAETRLADNDELEIVTLVGGG